jgi:hypothetical protein
LPLAVWLKLKVKALGIGSLKIRKKVKAF